MQTLALIANLLGLGLAITASLIKGKKIGMILVFVLFSNFMIASGYLLAGTGMNGAASCLLACVQVIINSVFESKNKPISKWLIGIYLLSFIVVNILVGSLGIATVIAILACSAFVASISQKNGKGYRICTIANCILWLTYDILTTSYSAIITHGVLLAVSVAGLLMHDIKKNK